MASGSIALLSLPVTASAALAPFRGVTAAGAYPTAGAGIRGATRTAANPGDLVTADIVGTALMEAAGTCTLGGPLMVDVTGRVLDKTSTNVVVGYALTGTTTAGAVIEVLLAGPSA